jgi:hypothetical protein
MTEQRRNELTHNHPSEGDVTTVHPRIKRYSLPVSKLTLVSTKGLGEYKSQKEMDVNCRLALPDGSQFTVTDKLWRTFSQAYGLSRNVFNYFSADEVFSRVCSKRNHDEMRLTVEEFDNVQNPSGRLYANGQALTLSRPDKAFVSVNDANSVITRYGGKGAKYQDGVVTASFDCPFPMKFVVGEQDSGYKTMFHVRMPLDGYGLPASYLMLLRLVCSNGMVAMTKAFKTEFSLGKDESSLLPALNRGISSFTNEEGFHAFRDRLVAAMGSWASLYEFLSLVRTINSACTADSLAASERTEILDTLEMQAKRPHLVYGLVAGDEPQARIQRVTPVEMTIYDLLNFATEVGTHCISSLHGQNRINAWVGDMITQGNFDLEGSTSSYPDFTDFFLDFKGDTGLGQSDIIQ